MAVYGRNAVREGFAVFDSKCTTVCVWSRDAVQLPQTVIYIRVAVQVVGVDRECFDRPISNLKFPARSTSQATFGKPIPTVDQNIQHISNDLLEFLSNGHCNVARFGKDKKTPTKTWYAPKVC